MDTNIDNVKAETNFQKHQFILGYGLKKIKNPELFQGNTKRKNYFEGWYFKMVSADGSSILSVIPGISLSHNGERQHAFIQIIDGKTADTAYFSFPISEFSFSKREFAIRIGDNYFSKDSVILNIQQDGVAITGEINNHDQVSLYPENKNNRGIMGWYRFVPFMQCYHGVVSLHHRLMGTITMNDKAYGFDGGVGYIEKDWGRSMPSAWIWMQTNNFESLEASFMLSIAHIPWLGKSFTGFLGFFLHDGKVKRFATYTHAKLQLSADDSNSINITITAKNQTYHIETFRSDSGMLKAPVKGSMDRRIAESINAKLILTVTDKNNNTVFHDSSTIAGLEIVGDMESLGAKIGL